MTGAVKSLLMRIQNYHAGVTVSLAKWVCCHFLTTFSFFFSLNSSFLVIEDFGVALQYGYTLQATKGFIIRCEFLNKTSGLRFL